MRGITPESVVDTTEALNDILQGKSIKVGMKAIDLAILNIWFTVEEYYPEVSFERFLCDHIESLRILKDIA